MREDRLFIRGISASLDAPFGRLVRVSGSRVYERPVTSSGPTTHEPEVSGKSTSVSSLSLDRGFAVIAGCDSEKRASSWEQSAPPSEDLLIPFIRTNNLRILDC